MYQLAYYEGGRDYDLFLRSGSPLIEPSLTQKPVDNGQEPTGSGHFGRVGTFPDLDTLVVRAKFGIASNRCLCCFNSCPPQPFVTRLGNPAVKHFTA